MVKEHGLEIDGWGEIPILSSEPDLPDPLAAPVILLHGRLFSGQAWADIGMLDRLEDCGITTYAPTYDLQDDDVMRARLAHDSEQSLLAEIIDQLELNDRKPAVVAASIGGVLLKNCLQQAPDRVGGVVLVGAFGFDELPPNHVQLDIPAHVTRGTNDPALTHQEAALAIDWFTNAYFEELGDGHAYYLTRGGNGSIAANGQTTILGERIAAVAGMASRSRI